MFQHLLTQLTLFTQIGLQGSSLAFNKCTFVGCKGGAFVDTECDEPQRLTCVFPSFKLSYVICLSRFLGIDSKVKQGALNRLMPRKAGGGSSQNDKRVGSELAYIIFRESRFFQSLGQPFCSFLIRCSKTVILAPGSSWYAF